MPRLSYIRRLVATSSIFVAGLLGSTAISAKPAQVPASRISIDMPEGYEPANQFPGFINANTGASLIAVEMPPAAFADFKKSDFAAKLSANGFANVKPGTLPFAGEHIYLTAEQATAAGAFSKFLLIFADAKATAMLTFNVPKADVTSGKTTFADIEKVLTTARFAAEPAKPAAALFKMSYLGPFKPAGALAGAQMYTRDGKMSPDKPEPGRAVFVIAPSVDKQPITDVALTSRVALASMFDLEAGNITRQGAISIDGLDGFELEIDAPRKAPTGRAVAYQVILAVRDGGYIRMIGTAEPSEAGALLPEFRKMAASVKAAPPK